MTVEYELWVQGANEYSPVDWQTQPITRHEEINLKAALATYDALFVRRSLAYLQEHTVFSDIRAALRTPPAAEADGNIARFISDGPRPATSFAAEIAFAHRTTRP